MELPKEPEKVADVGKQDEKATNDAGATKQDDNFPSTKDFERVGLARVLGLDTFSGMDKYKPQMDRLIDWAHAKGAVSREDIAWQVRQLMGRVGGPHLGTHLAQHLSQYAYLEMERMKLDKQTMSQPLTQASFDAIKSASGFYIFDKDEKLVAADTAAVQSAGLDPVKNAEIAKQNQEDYQNAFLKVTADAAVPQSLVKYIQAFEKIRR